MAKKTSTHNIVGQLRQFITIQRHETFQDEAGFETKEWRDIGRVRAKVDKMRIEDKDAYGYRKSWNGTSGLVTTLRTHVFIIRNTDITNLDRIVYRDVAYEVKEIDYFTTDEQYISIKAIEIC